MNYVLDKILIDGELIKKRVKELGEQITRDYAGKQPITLCILRGAIPFFADLIREIDLPVTVDTITVSAMPMSIERSESAIRGIIKARRSRAEN